MVNTDASSASAGAHHLYDFVNFIIFLLEQSHHINQSCGRDEARPHSALLAVGAPLNYQTITQLQTLSTCSHRRADRRSKRCL